MTDEPSYPLRANLRRKMVEKEMAPVELAKRAKVSLPYVSQLLSGSRTNPRLPVLRRLARVLGTTATALQAPPVEEPADVAAAS